MARTGLLTRWAVVPDLVGLTVDEARFEASRAGLAVRARRSDGLVVEVLGAGSWQVVAQQPRHGPQVRRRTPVVLTVEPGGGSAGVREPRRPLPVHDVDAGAGEP